MPGSKAEFKLSLLVRQICVKIALNVIKASKLVQMKLIQCTNIKIKIRVGGILKTFWFCSYTNMAASDKGISLKKKMLEKVSASRIKCNQWKQ